MHKSGETVSFWSAVAMGIGAMVGAGIFALLGQAGLIAGSAVWLSFVAGGIIALFSGYSMGRLGARFPSSGGLAITFFAYEGFRIITNAAEDMDDPARTLPREIMTSIALVMVLYVAVAFAVFGNLTA